MIFTKLSLETKPIFERYLDQNPLFADYYGSELNFQNLMVWKDTDQIEVAETPQKYLIVRSVNHGVACFFPPISRNWEDFFDALRWMEADSVDRNIPFMVRGMTDQMVDALQMANLKYRVSEDRDLFEYLYSSADLRTLSGKNYHNKRNLVNQFIKQNAYQIRSFESQDAPLVMALLSDWEEQKLHAFEHTAILNSLDCLPCIDCFADVILIDGKVVAFAVGTKNTRMGLVLFEKADTSFTGAYAAINTLFANRHFADVDVINRQEDLGIAELRKAKLSYHPIGFAKKYTITRNHLTREEVAQLKTLYHEAFDDSEGFLNYFFQQKYRADNVIFHKKDHVIVSALHFVAKTLSVRHTLILCPFVVAAATLKSYRHQGIMHTLLRQAFFELYNRKISLCGLSPFAESFYAKAGFVTVTRSHTLTYEISPTNRFTYETVGPADLSKVAAIYQTKMQYQAIYIERTMDYWQSFYEEVQADDGRIILVIDEGTAIGYFTEFVGRAEELCFPDETMIPLIDRLSGLELTLPNPQASDSHAMIRIVNVKKYLLEIPYAKEIDLVMRLRITDAFFELNNVTIELTIKDGIATMRDIEEFDVEIAIEQLTEQLFVTGCDLFATPSTLLYDAY